MSYKRGSFRHKPVNTKGDHNTTKNHFNAKVVRSGFKQLASVVNDVAGITAASVVSKVGTYEMSFDETSAIPATVPSTGNIQVVIPTDNPGVLDVALLEMSNQALELMQEDLINQLKEAGL